MKKMIKVLAFAIAVLMLFASCSSMGRTGRVGMYPMRTIPVNSISELQSGSFEILGTVEGNGNVSVRNPEDGDTYSYGSLEFLEGDRMYYTIDIYSMDDPYEVALSNATAEMIKNAQELGAAFITFPSYTIDLVDGRVIAHIEAVAVKLVNPPAVEVVEDNSPIRIEVITSEAN